MRGEDEPRDPDSVKATGSPPHARGRRAAGPRQRESDGITPACAGKTPACSCCCRFSGDHPRMRGEDRVVFRLVRAQDGSPPHARGRLCPSFFSGKRLGITPACAGKTEGLCSGSGPTQDHPRMRGEDVNDGSQEGGKTGSPPHARGRLSPPRTPLVTLGITPACVGKTRTPRNCAANIPDHPRMRGEDLARFVNGATPPGSPPHARGRLSQPLHSRFRGGITPACAGKTPGASERNAWKRDHPRMRGEDGSGVVADRGDAGSPPHARGRPTSRDVPGTISRITPACAGKTGSCIVSVISWGDHPRMRGEDFIAFAGLVASVGSPPHARGRPPMQPVVFRVRRITPACAGKTFLYEKKLKLSADHPRMRGEDTTDLFVVADTYGSPPHARGRHLRHTLSPRTHRITPACAGKTRAKRRRSHSKTDHPRMRGEDSTTDQSDQSTKGSPPHARGRQHVFYM